MRITKQQGDVERMPDIPDPGFCEGDIKLSIKETAQSHINWIYESILSRMEPSVSLRLREQERRAVRAKSEDLYKEYLGDVLSTLER